MELDYGFETDTTRVQHQDVETFQHMDHCIWNTETLHATHANTTKIYQMPMSYPECHGLQSQAWVMVGTPRGSWSPITNMLSSQFSSDHKRTCWWAPLPPSVMVSCPGCAHHPPSHESVMVSSSHPWEANQSSNSNQTLPNTTLENTKLAKHQTCKTIDCKRAKHNLNLPNTNTKFANANTKLAIRLQSKLAKHKH